MYNGIYHSLTWKFAVALPYLSMAKTKKTTTKNKLITSRLYSSRKDVKLKPYHIPLHM